MYVQYRTEKQNPALMADRVNGRLRLPGLVGFVLLFAFLLPTPAQAEERIELTGGEQLIGALLGVEGGHLLLQSRLIEDPVRIPIGTLAVLHSDRNFWLELTGGERLRGTLDGSTGKGLVLRSRLLGTVRLTWSDVVTLKPDDSFIPPEKLDTPRPSAAAGNQTPSLAPPTGQDEVFKTDRILLAKGDRLSGSLLRMEKGRLTIRTPLGDPVRVAFESVRGIQTRQPVTLLLDTEERWIGRLVLNPGGDQLFLAKASGEQRSLSLDRIRSINPEERVWSLSLSLKGGFQEGNRDRFDSQVDLDVRRKTETDRLGLRFRFRLAEEEGSRTARNWFSQLKYDYYFQPRRYVFVASEMSEDEFKDLDLRTASSVGFGYRVIEHPKFDADLEAGLTHIFEDFKTEEDQRMAVRLASEFRWRITERIRLTNQLLLFPSLEGSELQLRSETGFKVNLLGGLDLDLSFILEHDTDAPSGTRKTDVQGLAGIVYRIRF